MGVKVSFIYLFQDMSIDYYTDFESEKLSWAEEDRYFNQAISQLSQDFRWVRRIFSSNSLIVRKKIFRFVAFYMMI